MKYSLGYYLLFQQLNASSAETIHNVTKMKFEITQTFQNVSRVLNQSSALNTEADRQRQVFLPSSFLTFYFSIYDFRF